MAHPVIILTGFLGAGKTTFLNQILEENAEKKFAIIENEFGEQSIDAELIVRPDDSIVEMNNGCLCCTLNDNLYDILNELKLKSEQFEELIIETTGIADPAGVANPFFTDSQIKKDFPIRSVICLVDVMQIEKQLLDTEEAIKQIVFSDIILLNKVSNCTNISEIEAKIKLLNPFAKIYIESNGKFNTTEILTIERDQDFKTGGSSKLSSEAEHHHHGDIESISFVFERPFDAKELQMRLYGYLVFHAVNLYRVKGIIYAKDVAHRLIVQSVGQNLSITGGRQWEENEEKISKLVFIGKKIDKEFLTSLLAPALI